jgi:archaellum component FlaC
MSIHDDIIADITNHPLRRFMVESGFSRIDVVDDNVIFEPITGGKHIVPLSSPDEIFQTLADIQREQSGIGFTEGFNLSRKTMPRSKYTGEASLLQKLGIMPGPDSTLRRLSSGYIRRHGIARNAALVRLAREGYEVDFKIFKNPDAKYQDKLMNLLDDMLINPQAKTLDEAIEGLVYRTGSGGAAVLRIKDKSGQGYLASDKVANLLGFDFSAGDANAALNLESLLGKGSKRVRGHLQRKAISVELPNQNHKIAIFDPKSLFGKHSPYGNYIQELSDSQFGHIASKSLRHDAAVEAVEQIFDGGMMFLDPESLKDDVLDALKVEVDYDGSIGPFERRIRVAQYRKQTDMLGQPGMANVRITSSNIVGSETVSGLADVADRGAGIHLKGNINLQFNKSSDELRRIAKQAKGTDHVTYIKASIAADALDAGITILAPSSNLTDELVDSSIEANNRMLLNLDPFHDAGFVRTNPTALVGQPQFFDPEEILKHANEGIRTNLDSLTNTGKLTGEFEGYLRHQASEFIEDIRDLSDLDLNERTSRIRAMEEARSIVAFLDAGGDIRQDPSMVSRATSSLRNMYFGVSDVKPRMIVPNARSGHMLSDTDAGVAFRGRHEFGGSYSKGSAFNSGGKLKKGWISYDSANSTFVMSDVDRAEHQRLLTIHGGADYDDTLNAILRYDRKSQTIKALAFRNPTGYGEAAVYNMALDDELAMEFMRKSETYQAIQATIDTAHDDLVRLDSNPNLTSTIERETERQRLKKIVSDSETRLRTTLAKIADETFEEYSDLDVAQYNAQYKQARSVKNIRSGEDLFSPVYSDVLSKEKVRFDLSGPVVSKAREFLARMVGNEELSSHLDFTTFIESLYQNYGDETAEAGQRLFMAGGLDPKALTMFPREGVIDFFTQMAGASPETKARVLSQFDKNIEAIGIALVDLADRGEMISLPFSTAAQYGRDGVPGGKLNSKIIEKFEKIVGDYSKGRYSYIDFVGKENEDVGLFGQFRAARNRAARLVDEEISNVKRQIHNLSLNAYYSEGYNDAAKSVVERFKQASKDFDLEILDQGDTSGLHGIRKKVKLNSQMIEDIMKSANELAKEMNVPEHRALHEILMNVRSEAEQTKVLAQMMNMSFLDIEDGRKSLSGLLTTASIQDRINTVEKGSYLIDDPPTPVSQGSIDFVESYSFSDDEIRNYGKGSLRRQLRDEVDSVSKAISNARMPNAKTIGQAGSELWSHSGFRKGSFAAAAVIASSMIYKRVNDRPEEAMTGPEFLPGGTAYETGYPKRGISMPGNPVLGSNSGTTYNIQADGNYDPDSLRAAAERITGAQSTGTVYSRGSARTSLDAALSSNFGI